LLASCETGPLGPDAIHTEISSTITEPLTLYANHIEGTADYLVKGQIEITSEVLIEAGAVIDFTPGSSFILKGEGRLVAIGTPENRIIFKPQYPDSLGWIGITFETKGISHQMEYCDIRQAGEKNMKNPLEQGSLLLKGSSCLRLVHVHVIGSRHHGIVALSDSAIFEKYESNMVSECQGAAVLLHLNQISGLDNQSSYTGNQIQYILVHDFSRLLVEGDYTWQKLNIPVLLPDRIVQISGNLTIEAGFTCLGQEGSGLKFRPESRIKVLGTNENPVVFKGMTEAPGSWVGIRVESAHEDNLIQNTIILHGGSESHGFTLPVRQSNIEIGSSGQLTLSRNTIGQSLGYGITVISPGIINQEENEFHSNILGDICNN
jgi:hypothetical protein